MTLQKKYLEVFFLALKGTEGILTLAEARQRDEFMKSLIETLRTFEADRATIYVKFCDKNEDGTPDLSDNKYKFKQEVTEELGKELTVLVDETVELTPGPMIKEILVKTTYSPKVGEAELIDAIIAQL